MNSGSSSSEHLASDDREFPSSDEHGDANINDGAESDTNTQLVRKREEETTRQSFFENVSAIVTRSVTQRAASLHMWPMI